MINGLVEKELIFTLDDLKRFPRKQNYFLDARRMAEWSGKARN